MSELLQQLNSALAQNPMYDGLIDRFFNNIDDKNLLEHAQACLNEYRMAVRKAVIEDGRIDLFITEVLGYQMKPFHERVLMAQESLAKVGDYYWSLVLGFRGSGKSTVGTVGRATFEIVRNPDLRILIVSNTGLQAEVFLREIKAHLENNQNLIDIFGNYVGPKWDSKEIVVAPRKALYREASITCLGFGGATASRHYDLIIVDDLVDEENSRTPMQREKLRVWFYKSLLPTLVEGGRIMCLGTLWNPEDLNNYLIKNTPGLKPCVVRALDDNEPGGTPWPEKFSVEHFIALRQQMGLPEFESQYQMNTEAMKGRIFSYEMFHWYDELPKGDLRYYQGVDLAISTNSEADFFAECTIAVDPGTNKKYVVDIFQKRARFSEQTSIIQRKYYQFDPILCAIEANAYQAAQVQAVIEADNEMRVRPVITMKDKVTRGMKLSARVETGEILFRKDQIELIDQLIKLPDGDHDDLFDSLDIAVQAATRGYRKRREKEPGLL